MLICVFMLCCHEHWLHVHSRALAWAADSGPCALLCSSSIPAGVGQDSTSGTPMTAVMVSHVHHRHDHRQFLAITSWQQV